MSTFLLNWIDVLSIALLIFSFIEGWRLGFVHLSSSFMAYAIAFIVSMTYHRPVGSWIVQTFGIPQIWTDSIGYISLIVLSLVLFTKIFLLLSEKIVTRFIHTVLDRTMGVIISSINALCILVFTFVAIASVPDAIVLKEGVEDSKIARIILGVAQRYGGTSIVTLEQSIKDNVTFITIDPLSKETIQLPFSLQRWNLMDDLAGASQMITLINKERVLSGLHPLFVDEEVSRIALLHSRDMFERKYFSHSSPEGKTIKDRLQLGNVIYTSAAENLAFAPDVTTAHKGLMASVSHKAAILDPIFTRIGVGVVDSGGVGIMVTEVFIR
jgi:uncharacterized protein YkwD